MFRDGRNSIWSREPSSTLMKTLVSGENHNVSKLVFSLCILDCLAKLQDTAMSLLHCSPSQNFLQRQSSLLGLSYHFLMQSSVSTFKKPVFHHLWFCSIILKMTLHIFVQSDHITIIVLMHWILLNRHSTNAPGPVRCVHLNAPYSYVA